MFVINRGTNGGLNDALYRYDLSKPFDVSTCQLVQLIDPETSGALNDWRSGAVGMITRNTMPKVWQLVQMEQKYL